MTSLDDTFRTTSTWMSAVGTKMTTMRSSAVSRLFPWIKEATSDDWMSNDIGRRNEWEICLRIGREISAGFALNWTSFCGIRRRPDFLASCAAHSPIRVTQSKSPIETDVASRSRRCDVTCDARESGSAETDRTPPPSVPPSRRWHGCSTTSHRNRPRS